MGRGDVVAGLIQEVSNWEPKASLQVILGEDFPDGHLMLHEACTHSVENAGTKYLRAIILKQSRSDISRRCYNSSPEG